MQLFLKMSQVNSFCTVESDADSISKKERKKNNLMSSFLFLLSIPKT